MRVKLTIILKILTSFGKVYIARLRKTRDSLWPLINLIFTQPFYKKQRNMLEKYFWTHLRLRILLIHYLNLRVRITIKKACFIGPKKSLFKTLIIAFKNSLLITQRIFSGKSIRKWFLMSLRIL